MARHEVRPGNELYVLLRGRAALRRRGDPADVGIGLPALRGYAGYTDLHLRDTFHGIPTDEVWAVLGENAIACFGLDCDKLRSIAAAIGPRPIDVPIDRVPDVPGSAFRARGSWS